MQSSEGLVVSGLAVERGGRALLAGLGFTVRPGQALAVTGPNGVGKSTLLRALAGLMPRSAGEVALRLGQADDEAPLGERLHYVGHGNGLKAGLTAAANLRFLADWRGRGGIPPEAALAAVGLSHCAEIPVGFLSAGQKRRVALAALLVAPRPLWLLDEPATALDQGAESLLVALIARHVEAGGLALMALHAPLALPVTTLRLGQA